MVAEMTRRGAILRCQNPACKTAGGHVWIQRAPKPPNQCPSCGDRHWNESREGGRANNRNGENAIIG